MFSNKSVLMAQNFHGALSALVRKVSGEKKSDCAIVIPSADATELLDAHLAILARQTMKDFDVLVLGKPPGMVPEGINIILFAEKYPLGSSGGFGIGRALAYSLGYEYIINSDVDCTPISANLVERLVADAKEGQCAMFPKSVEYEGSEVRKTFVTNQYGIVTRKVLETVGFDYFRLYRGSEDYDMNERLRMHNAGRQDETVSVKHKSHIFDYISLLKFRGNKYIYYKKSYVIASILLARHAISMMKLSDAARYCATAFFEMVKTQLFYSQYPDITGPVYDGLLMRTNTVSVARTSRIEEIEAKDGMKGAAVCAAGETVPAGAKKIGFGNGGKLSIAKTMLSAWMEQCDYFEPTEKFLDAHGQLLPVLMLAKGVKCADGKIYSTKLGFLRTAANFALTAILAPLYAIAIPFAIVRAAMLEYPITPANMESNLAGFLAYVEKFEEEKKKFERENFAK